MEFLITLWSLFGIGTALVASNKGETKLGWFFVGFFLGPFGLLFSLFICGKVCKFCKSRIHQQAKICPKCQNKFDLTYDDLIEKYKHKSGRAG